MYDVSLVVELSTDHKWKLIVGYSWRGGLIGLSDGCVSVIRGLESAAM